MEVMLITAAFDALKGPSAFFLAACFRRGSIALVNIMGAAVFVVKVSISWSTFTKFILVDLGEMPALLNNTFNPSSLTISWTCLAKVSYVSNFFKSVYKE